MDVIKAFSAFVDLANLRYINAVNNNNNNNNNNNKSTIKRVCVCDKIAVL